MTLEHIEKRVKDIAEMEGDYEAAHGMEDRLRAEFIAYVATLEIPSLAEKAKAVLQTDKLDFPRDCA